MIFEPDLEYRLTDEHHESLRLWLRLLTCTTMIERAIRQRLRDRFDITLAALRPAGAARARPDGTQDGRTVAAPDGHRRQRDGLVDQLAGEGYVERRAVPADRRVHAVYLTPAGRARFAAMAAARALDCRRADRGLAPDERDSLHHLLGRLKASVGDGEPSGRGARGR